MGGNPFPDDYEYYPPISDDPFITIFATIGFAVVSMVVFIYVLKIGWKILDYLMMKFYDKD